MRADVLLPRAEVEAEMARRTVRYLVITPLEAEMARRTVRYLQPYASQPEALVFSPVPTASVSPCIK